MPLREDILVPIPGGNPSGIDLRYDTELPIYDKIKEARRQDDSLAQGDWQSERKTADFPLIVQLAQDSLATISKDIQLAAWLTEALLQTEGFSGLRQGLELCLNLLSNYWDTIYPVIEDGDQEFRAMPLNWLGSKLDIPLRSTPITSTGYSWLDYRDSRTVGYEDQIKTDQDRAARTAMNKSGKVTPEVFDKACIETPKAFYLQAEQDLDGCLEVLADLNKFCNEKFEDDAPAFDTLKSGLIEVRHTIHLLLEKKRAWEPEPVEAEAVGGSTSDCEFAPAPPPHPGWFTSLFKRTSTLSEEPPAQTVTDTSPISPPATNPSRLRGFSTPGISDSASAEGSFTQFFKATSSAPPYAPEQPSPEPSESEIGSVTRLIQRLSQVEREAPPEPLFPPFPTPAPPQTSSDPGEFIHVLSERTAKTTPEVSPNERKWIYHAEATALSGSLPLSSASGESGNSLAASPDAETTKLGDTTLVSVFYATDRMQLPSLTNKTAFGKQRSLLGSLHYGRCEVSIPKTHKLGKLETPSILRLEFTPNPAKHIVLAGTFSLEEQKFFEMVQSSIAKSAARDAFVFVHGYNVSFENAARRTGQMAFDLNFVGAPIFYSWPSNGKTADYPKDETNVTWSTPHLQRFLALLAQNTSAKRIYVIAHSMGNRAVCDALKLLSYDPDCQLKLAHLVLAAPDIDADTFRELASMLQKLSGRITLYESSRDLALLASKKIHGNPRAGEPLLVLPGLDTIDASAIDTDFLGHSYFSDTWPLLSDIHSILFEDQPPERRFGLMAQENPGGRYYAFRA